MAPGAIAGIAIGGVIGVALIIIAAFLWQKKRKRRHELADTSIPRQEKVTPTVVDITPEAAKPELDGDRDIHEMNEQRNAPELPAYEGVGGRHELVQVNYIHELDGEGIAPAGRADAQRDRRFSWED